MGNVVPDWRQRDRARLEKLRTGEQSNTSEIITLQTLRLTEFEKTAKSVAGLSAKQRPSAKDAAFLLLAQDRKMPGAAMAVFIVLVEAINWKNGTCFPGYAYIVKRTDRDRATVIRAVNLLAGHGYILVLSRPPLPDSKNCQSNKYTIPALLARMPLVASPFSTGGSDAERVVAPTPPKPLNSTLESKNLSSLSQSKAAGRQR